MNLIYLSFMIQCTYADVNYLGSIKDKPLQYHLQKKKRMRLHMAFISIFDVLGPEMIGPSSSHTAGACSIALLAGKMADSPITHVEFTLYQSFAKTHKGHGTDLALLGGIMGFSTDDRRIPLACSVAEERGLSYRFITDDTDSDTHPNTVDIRITCLNGRTYSVRGESLGGGKVRISRIDHIDVDFSGEYSTLIIIHRDRLGVLAHITRCLSEGYVNIAFMKLFRETKGDRAYSIIEFDGSLPDHMVSRIYENPDVQDVMFIPVKGENENGF